jgi:peptidyl-prolyl cis-trans isomerase B (cyclophilin B)
VSPSRREREYARRRYEKWAAKQQERVAARRRAQRNAIAIGLSVIVVLGIAIGAALLRRTSSTATAASPSASATPSASAGASNAADPCPAPPAKPPATPGSWKTAPPKMLAADKSWKLTLKTTCGDVVAKLDGSKAPQAVSSAIFLSRNGFWNGSPCHRLTTQGIYVLQCGDPSGKGTGGPGYTFNDENLKGAKYPMGTVAMANSGPNTNGSQFFLVYKDTQLDPNYTPFGTITKGLDIINKVAAAGAVPTGDGKPKLSINILSVRVEPTKA